jgi:hypothetical protein
MPVGHAWEQCAFDVAFCNEKRVCHVKYYRRAGDASPDFDGRRLDAYKHPLSLRRDSDCPMLRPMQL